MFYNLHFQFNGLVWTIFWSVNITSSSFQMAVYFGGRMWKDQFSMTWNMTVCHASFYQEFKRTANSQELSGSRRLERRSSEKVSYTVARGWENLIPGQLVVLGACCLGRWLSVGVGIAHSLRLLQEAAWSLGEGLFGGRWLWRSHLRPAGCSVNSPHLSVLACSPVDVREKEFWNWLYSFITSLAATSFPSYLTPSAPRSSHSTTNIWCTLKAITSWIRHV